jgi:hypothetical protein
VTVTAEVEGKKATSSLSTYGLEMVGGTVVTPAGFETGSPELLGTAFTWRIIDMNGEGVSTTDSGEIIGPIGFNNGLPVGFAANYSGLSLRSRSPIVGVYSAKIQSGGVSYSSKFSFDLTKKLGFPTNIQVSDVTTTSATVIWNSVADSQYYSVGICGKDVTAQGFVTSAVVRFDAPLIRGQSYKVCINAWNYHSTFPSDQVLRSINSASFLVP